VVSTSGAAARVEVLCTTIKLAHVGQVRLQRFQREDFDAPRVEAAVVGV
jgi:hypothetical protein